MVLDSYKEALAQRETVLVEVNGPQTVLHRFYTHRYFQVRSETVQMWQT